MCVNYTTTCLEYLTYIIRKIILQPHLLRFLCIYANCLAADYAVHAALYGMFFTHLCKQSSRLEDVLDIEDIVHLARLLA